MTYFLWGYYGFHNLGDELVLQALCRGIQERDEQARFFVRCREAPWYKASNVTAVEIEAPRAAAGFLKKVLRYLTGYWVRIVKILMASDVLVIGGGTLFIDKGRFSRSLLEMLLVTLCARVLGKKAVAVGVGVDDLGHPLSRFCFKRQLRLLGGAWFREKEGFEAARRLAPGIHESADLVYSLDWGGEKLPARGRGVGLVLADTHANYGAGSGEDRRKFLDEMAVALRGIFDEGTLDPLFLVFQPGLGFRGDAFSGEMVGLLGWRNRARILTPTPDPLEVGALFKGMGLMIGMHYHALVLAALHGVPFVAISHERKFEDVCARFEMPCLPIGALRADGLREAARDAMKRPIREDVLRREKELSGRNFEWVSRK